MAEQTEAGRSPGTPEWLTVEQAAEWLQVSTKTIRRYIEAGSLTAVNLGGRAIRIRRQDLDAWLESRRIEPGVSLRKLERLERHQAHSERRNQKIAKVRRSPIPRRLTAEELANVKVSIAQTDPLLLRCDICGAIWTPELRPNGKPARRFYCCPNGCNCK